jgi:hydroxyethylthiazole kinase
MTATSTIEHIRIQNPLVLFLTNTVTEALCANVLLAFGGSPVMSHDPQELADLMGIANALVINIGTLENHFLHQAQQAIALANANKRPIVFDPVGAGASQYRTEAAQSIVSQAENVTIRANGSELRALAGMSSSIKGVDSTQSSALAIDAARSLLERSSIAQVIVTGEQDFVFSRSGVTKNTYGHPLMTRVTGMGCALNGCLAASLTVDVDPSLALFETLQFYTKAAQKTAQHYQGPGTFLPHFLDALAQ